jgi:hypothetical protein
MTSISMSEGLLVPVAVAVDARTWRLETSNILARVRRAREVAMELVKLATVQLMYTTLEVVDFGSGGQLYGTMDGSLTGDRLNGTLRLTNLAPRRADNVNLPTLRGLLTTDDGAAVWVELDGIATLRPSDGARVFVTSFRFRTGDERYQWLNTVLAVLEGVLDSVGVGGVARGELHDCRATVT